MSPPLGSHKVQWRSMEMRARWTITALFVAALAAGPALGVWTGAGDGTKWSDTNNWSDLQVPL